MRDLRGNRGSRFRISYRKTPHAQRFERSSRDFHVFDTLPLLREGLRRADRTLNRAGVCCVVRARLRGLHEVAEVLLVEVRGFLLRDVLDALRRHRIDLGDQLRVRRIGAGRSERSGVVVDEPVLAPIVEVFERALIRAGLVRLRAYPHHEDAIRRGEVTAGFVELPGLVEIAALFRGGAELQAERRRALRCIGFIRIRVLANAAFGAVIEKQRVFLLALAVRRLCVFIGALHVAHERARAICKCGSGEQQRADQQRCGGDLVIHGSRSCRCA